MNWFYYKIMSQDVIDILRENMRLRGEGIKAALKWAESKGFKIGTYNDGCYESINIRILQVPESEEKYYRNCGKFWVPRKNRKGAKERQAELDSIQIKLRSPFDKIMKEVGHDFSMVWDSATRRVGTPKCFPIKGDFYLVCPAIGEREPIMHNNYLPIKKWEWEKLLDELKESEKK